jgi:hypothetical protein
MSVRAEKAAKSNGHRRPHTTEQVGAATFSDLVRAHYTREQERSNGAGGFAEAESEFCKRLARFEEEEGKLAAVYWSTQDASAVALTIGSPRGKRNPITDTDADVRLHRVTDWVTKEAEPVAELLHEADVLGIRVREVLRGTSQRIAMQWLYSVQEHALGFLERRDGRNEKVEAKFVDEQRAELARIEKYYLRTGSKAGRIVYVTGMLWSAGFIVLVCAIASLVFAGTSHYLLHHGKTGFLLLAAGAGSLGALVSVLSRMSSGDERFTVDFEVGRPLMRRLGLYKPFVGAVFGVASYFLFGAGLLPTESTGDRLYFIGIIAFLAGFSERFTGVIFGNAERLVGGAAPAEPPAEPDAPAG